MTLRAPDAADGFSTVIWGSRGRLEIPVDDVDAPVALTLALDELAEHAANGILQHDTDVRFGRDIVRLLAEAESQLAALKESR
jgi:hypothetical protein